MALGDAPDDGQPQAAAGFVILRPAIEAVENPFPFFDGNTRTRVADVDEWSVSAGPDRDVDFSSVRGVADGVADQVADQDAQRLFLAIDDRLASRRHRSEIDPPRFGQRQMRGDDAGDQFRERHRGQRSIAAAGFLASQGQELLHGVRGALQTALDFGKSLGARRRITGAFGELHLQGQRRQGGTQFVGGVGDEFPLRIERALEPGQQIVQRQQQRQHFTGDMNLRQGLEGDRCARAYRSRHGIERSQSTPDHDPDQHAEYRQHDEKRCHCPQGGSERQLVAQEHRLRDLDRLPALLHAENPPPAMAAVDRRKADRRLRRKFLSGVRKVDAGPVRAPDLDREILCVFFDTEVAPRSVLEDLIAQ